MDRCEFRNYLDRMESQTSTEFKDIDILEANYLIHRNLQRNDFALIDVRTPEEFTKGHIYTARNIDYFSGRFKEEVDKLDKNKAYLIYCRSGKRSEGALEAMKELGFTRVYHMKDGIIHWAGKGLPLIQDSALNPN